MARQPELSKEEQWAPLPKPAPKPHEQQLLHLPPPPPSPKRSLNSPRLSSLPPVFDESIYHQALENGTARVSYGRVMFLGPAAVGKTSLRHGLMNKPLPDKANSTVLAHTRPVRYSWAKTGSSSVHHWTEVSEEDEISEEVRLCHQYRHSVFNWYGISGINKSHCDTAQQRSEISVHKEKVVSKLKSMPMYSGGTDEVLLHLWDCGGQPVFLDVLPAFLSSRTVFLLMFDASKSLQAPFQVIVNDEGQQNEEEVLEVSILSLLQKWMASIHVRFCRSGPWRLPDYPRIILVGTHADQFAVDKPQEEKLRMKKQLFDDIFAVIKEKEYADIVLGGMLVDNTCAGKSNQAGSGFKELQQWISNFVQGNLTVETPVSWVHFRKVLQLHVKKRKPVISLEEVYSIAAECHVPREAVPSALLFYHDLGVFLFYANIESLNSVVILEPQWLVDQFGELLAKWRRKSEHMNMWNTLTQYGILVEPLYEALLNRVQEHGLTPSSLVKILEHFLLAAPIVTEGVHSLSGKVEVEFFVPLMLQHHLQPYSSQLPPSPGVVSAALVHLTFISGYVPPGYYVRLATCLATKKEIKVLFLSGIYRNQITMNVGDVDRLVIIEHGDTIELHFSRQSTMKEPFRESCHRILLLLDGCFKEIQQWLPGAEVQLAFLCSKCQANTSHTSIPFRGKYVTFTINQLVSKCLQCQMGHHFLPSSAERYWLQPDPTVFEADEVAVPLTCDEVFQLAERLKVDPIFAVMQQFCRNGGGNDEITQAVADVKQMSRNITLSQTTCPRCTGKDHSSSVEVSAMKRQHDADTPPGHDSGTDYGCYSGSTTTKKRKKDDPLQKSPELKELMSHVAAKTKVKWYQVGIQLNIELATLKTYETQSSVCDPMRCYADVFAEWKRAGEPPYTWATIIEALESDAVSEKDTASNVRKWLTDSQ